MDSGSLKSLAYQNAYYMMYIEIMLLELDHIYLSLTGTLSACHVNVPLGPPPWEPYQTSQLLAASINVFLPQHQAPSSPTTFILLYVTTTPTTNHHHFHHHPHHPTTRVSTLFFCFLKRVKAVSSANSDIIITSWW